MQRFTYLWVWLLGLLILAGCAQPSLKPQPTPEPLSVRDQARLAFFAGQLAEKKEDYERAVTYYRQVLKLDPEANQVRKSLVQDYIRLSQFDQAAAEYQKLLKHSPEDQGMKYIWGQLHEASGNIKMAEKIYRDAVKMGHKLSGPYTRLGVLLLKQEKNKEGLFYLHEALHINPEDRDARLALMSYFLIHDQWAKAAVLLEAGLKTDENNFEWLAYLARLYQEHQNPEKAKILYEKIVRLYPDYPPAYQFLAQYYLQAGSWGTAIPYLQKYLAQEPDNEVIKKNLGLAYYEAGRYEEAQKLFFELSQADPEDALSHYFLGSIYAKKKLYFLAEHEMELSIKLNSGLKEAYGTLAGLLDHLGDTSKALALLGIATVKFKDDPTLFLQYGLLLAKNKNYAYALKQMTQALALDNKNPDILFHLGRIYYLNKDYDRAAHYWKKCIRADDRYAEAYNYLGYSYAERGIYLDQAIIWLKRALSLEPENGYYLDSLGWAYFQSHHYELALKTILHARQVLVIKELPVDAEILEHLGDIYFKLKRYPEAREEWTKSLAQDPDNEQLKQKLKSIPSLGGLGGEPHSLP